MIAAGLQLDIAWEDPEENFPRAERLAAAAAGAGARLVVLPEMFATGFSMDAEKILPFTDRIREFLAGLALKLGVWIVGGFAEPGDPRPRNALSLLDPGGREILRYRKIHPFTLAGEPEVYGAGEEVFTAEVEGVRVTPLICYDLRFPELFRAAAERTDLFAVIANWPERRRRAWNILLRARAIENQAFVLGVNRVGVGGGEPHSGDSTLLDPFGRARDRASRREAVVRGAVDPGEVREARERFGFLGDRRPGVYRKLEEPSRKEE